jgi:predicted nucleotidyltransferase
MFKKMNLFSKTSLILLIFFATHPSTRFYEKEAAEEARVSPASANAVLSQLASAKLLHREHLGRMNFYKANLSNIFMRQFKVLLTIDMLEPVIDALTPYCSRIILYGSCSRGTDNERSDIDLFYQLIDDSRIKEADRAIEKVSKKLNTEHYIRSIATDTIRLEQMKKDSRPLYERIMQGITLWSRDNEL